MSELFLKLLNMSISASWLVLAVIVFRFVMKKSPKYINVLLWGIVGVRLICPFSIESVFSLIPSAETIPREILYESNLNIQTGITSADVQVNHFIEGDYFGEYYLDDNDLQDYNSEVQNMGEAVASGNEFQWMSVLSIVWMVGVSCLLLYTAFSYIRLRQKIITAIPLQKRVYQSENISSPFVMGIINPKIYLPFHVGESELDYVIAHEQAHIMRKDHWWKPLGFLLLSIYWFNPMMWLAYVLLCRDIELACDEKVIIKMDSEQRADYTQALLSCSAKHHSIAVCPLAFGEVGVKIRVKTILHYRKPGFWIILITAVVCVGIVVCFLTNPVKDSTETDSNLTATEEFKEEPKENYEISTPEISAPVDESTGPVELPVGNTGEISVEMDAETKKYFAQVLRNLLYDDVFPDGKKAEDEGHGVNLEFGVADVDGDKKEELVISYDPGVMAGMRGYIIGYDTEKKEINIQLEEFPLFTFLENGNLKALASHNQTYGEMWPYTLYQYRSQTDSYESVGFVYAEDKAIFEANNISERYPDFADVSKSGTVYYVSESTWGNTPIDETEYLKWLEEKHGNAAEFTIDLQPVTEENILKLEEEIIVPKLDTAMNGTFENIMGYSGYWVQQELVPHHYGRTYYANTSWGQMPIAESFGYEINDYIYDYDKDGITELICNVTYGDGAERVFAYRLHDGVVKKGYMEGDFLSDINTNGVGAIRERYIADGKKIVVTITDVDGITKRYEQSDYENFVWEPFQNVMIHKFTQKENMIPLKKLYFVDIPLSENSIRWKPDSLLE